MPDILTERKVKHHARTDEQRTERNEAPGKEPGEAAGAADALCIPGL